jgi:hypothetical protein
MHGPEKITSIYGIRLPKPGYLKSDHFHPVHADGLYTHTSNAVIRQKVVVYDGKGRISPEDRNQGT